MASYFMLFISDTKLHPDAGSIYNHKLANCITLKKVDC